MLSRLDKKEEESSLTEAEWSNRVELQNQFWEVAIRNESILAQKSRVCWLKEGDMNTKFFHLMINWRRRKNELKGLYINGVWSDEPKVVKAHVKDFFQQRFQEQPQPRPALDGVRFKVLTSEQNELLIAPFTEVEIRSAVWECGSAKCPGPDGFNFRFIKEFWGTLGGDICRFMREFHNKGRLPRGTNSAFITLIPKRDDPRCLSDYRPISLVGCMYKILSKVLANRLKRVLPSVIDERQSAFIGGRNILHSALVVNEVVDEAKRLNKPTLFFKVDYEKAYDSVCWTYLLYMLRRLGFNNLWVSWISECLMSSRVSVLVNGSPSEIFKILM
uniref:Transposon TX1 uncharacterized n=1 Tax=Cajanus cajan TaxID=3821 RepID=A0A151TFT8_CAJCA|nr:Transposon TX1 uncharacterized [Cajanus cajan]